MIVLFGSKRPHTVWASVIGYAYKLQFCSDLAIATWQNDGSPAAGSKSDLPFVAPVTRRCYRILILPEAAESAQEPEKAERGYCGYFVFTKVADAVRVTTGLPPVPVIVNG